MNRIWTFLINPRVIGIGGFGALLVFLFVGANTLELALIYSAIATVAALLIWLIVWGVRKFRARRAARGLETALEDEGAKAQKAAPRESKVEVDLLRHQLLDAIKTIKTSKLGETTGAAALYELPWYMVIGNPAAGKSTAIVKSGLTFPFADSKGSRIIQGIGGTRNCDWFFSTEGILLDTAGRYAVQAEDQREWFDFLGLLKKHRGKAPINGILIAASLGELSHVSPEAASRLARNLRQRVQELTQQLEVICPIYLVFTKADLIAGFSEFFGDSDKGERNRVWGATLSYALQPTSDAAAQFDKHFADLHNGLKELAVARMSLHRGQVLPPGVLTFPLEFAALQPALHSFVASLFDDNPYQFQPVFRGLYFTSAIQEGSASNRASDRVAERFGLTPLTEQAKALAPADNSFFLKDLFSQVIFPDRHLVKQYASRAKLRARGLTFAGAVGVLALSLAGWTWSYLGNRQLLENVRADLDKAVKLQQDRVDLASRLEALELLQDRIEQLRRYRDARPLTIGLGLYQGDAIERKLREEYFNGVRQAMLQPVSRSVEEFLGELNANAATLQPMTRPPESGAASVAGRVPLQGGRFSEASSDSVEDGYNALKTYLMLADRSRREPGHLTDQITRFWRGWLEAHRGAMPREQMIRSAERMISFALENVQDPAFPVLQNNVTLVEQTRENLNRVVRGMPARERVYAEVRARAATRYPPMTVARIVAEAGRDSVAGSYAVSGAFTREAWLDYIEPAFKDAAKTELQSVDWVLKTRAQDDLTLEGSPEQIRKSLTDLYKADYVREWQRFAQGITIAEFGSFDGAVARMNQLGDPSNSPIKKLITTLFDQTSWDNPTAVNERIAKAQAGLFDRLKQAVLGQTPSPVELKVDLQAGKAEIPMGPVGREFAALNRITMTRDSEPSLLGSYLQTLGKVRSRFNQIKTQGDAGPAARKLMASTFEGANSELSDALKFVDEQMLVGMTDSARATLRPLLVRPLIQSFTVIIGPTETEINRLWAAKVREPFERSLATKYPFDANSKMEAAPQEIAKVFGPSGAIAAFTDEALAALVLRRGDTITPRTWAALGLRLRPEFSSGFAGWVAPLEGAAAAAGAGGASGSGAAGGAAGGEAAASQTTFQVLPIGSPGLVEYTLEIDGQVLRYRNAAPAWTNFVWPNPSSAPGVRIVGVTAAGRSIEILNEPGRFGLTRMFEVAQRKKLPDGTNELSWSQEGQTVSLQLRVISQPGAASGPRSAGAGTAAPPVAASNLKGLRLPALVVGAEGVDGSGAVAAALAAGVAK